MMFETVQSFLAVFIPSFALIVLGILFEEKLIAFEDRIAQRLFGGKNKKRASRAARRPQQRPALHRVEPQQPERRKGKNCAA